MAKIGWNVADAILGSSGENNKKIWQQFGLASAFFKRKGKEG
jgi:hypothetical protein